MYQNLLEEYKKLSNESKKEKIIEELKLVVALLQLLCDHHNIVYEKLEVEELINFKNDDIFLDTVYSYITSLKEQLGHYVLENEEKKKND